MRCRVHRRRVNHALRLESGDPGAGGGDSSAGVDVAEERPSLKLTGPCTTACAGYPTKAQAIAAVERSSKRAGLVPPERYPPGVSGDSVTNKRHRLPALDLCGWNA